MDYKEKYEKAVQAAMLAKQDTESAITIGTLETIFPELKESEDDRIRKELLEHCVNRRDGKQVCVDASDYKRWADWLFRQGVENIPNVKSDKEISNEIIQFLQLPHPQFVGKRHQEEWIAWLEKQGEQKLMNEKSLYKAGYLDGFEDGVRDTIIKEEEQKPADKVEPKFKVGDWVIDKQGIVHQISNVIENVTNHTYSYDIVGGGYFNDNTEGVKLWTIQDAKDGDVLEFGDHGRLVTGILSFVNKTTGKVDVSCLLEGDKFKVGVFYNLDTVKPHPATKEQRDLLFKKMKEAGYEWDAKNKELKKSEDEPTWSVEDETMLRKAIITIDNVRMDTNFQEYYQGICDWLESLRDRVQPQPRQEWSEEDILHYMNVLEALEYVKGCKSDYDKIEAVKSDIAWLKSLRPQWKPNEEMLEALYRAIPKNVMEISEDEMLLDRLYQGLKYGRVLSEK